MASITKLILITAIMLCIIAILFVLSYTSDQWVSEEAKIQGDQFWFKTNDKIFGVYWNRLNLTVDTEIKTPGASLTLYIFDQKDFETFASGHAWFGDDRVGARYWVDLPQHWSGNVIVDPGCTILIFNAGSNEANVSITMQQVTKIMW